uniref:OSJNBa0020P07.2 protein n=1 Tax=Oryza sativa subsp. japonica TaxID=39947 RepID=Q7XTK2_ORYSJ|nr:OSJNBa0020P07.2 [Oryza sativa Japonica Group]
MVKTRNDPRDSNDASGSEEQTDEAHTSGAPGSSSSPPPENPTVTQMMTMMMQQMQQHYHQMLQQAQQNQQFGPPPSHVSKLLDFLRIQPPTFSSTTNPMEANDWLRAIEKKLNLLQCNDQEKVAFATHQLQGPASAGWDNYVVTRPDASSTIFSERSPGNSSTSCLGGGNLQE